MNKTWTEIKTEPQTAEMFLLECFEEGYTEQMINDMCAKLVKHNWDIWDDEDFNGGAGYLPDHKRALAQWEREIVNLWGGDDEDLWDELFEGVQY